MPQPGKPLDVETDRELGRAKKKKNPGERKTGESRLDVEAGRGKRLLCSNEALRKSLWEA